VKLGKLLRKGIEPIIAVVILVAVTLVIAIGVVGWIMGWWGAIGATESLQVIPRQQSCTMLMEWVLSFTLKNAGSASAVIYKVEISGVETLSIHRTLHGQTVSSGYTRSRN